MIPAVGYDGRRVGVLGLGRSGLAAARALAAGGARPALWDDGEAARTAAAAEGFDLADLREAATQRDLAALIVSPGVPHLFPQPHPAVDAALTAGTPLDNDIGLFFDWVGSLAPDRRPRVVAVTGSNGKSTTTALLAHALAALGAPVGLGGNIGRGVLDLAPLGGDGVYALELSSYQTDVARRLGADVAALTNFSPDHLDRHGGLGGYLAAKRRLFDAARARVIGVGEVEGRFLANACARASVVTVGPDAADLRYRAGRVDGPGYTIDLSAAPALPGAHNAQNAAVVLACLSALGFDPQAAAASFAAFPGLAHRLNRVAEINGVLFVNDSKATNADAASHALAAYRRIRWIAGGRPKEGGISPLAPFFDRIEKAYLIGEAAESFARTIGAAAPHAISGDLATAVAAAAAEAQPGDVVLFSPACASFDQFRDFEARGDAFVGAVRSLSTPS